MNFWGRNVTSKINWCMNNLLPPIVRDMKWLCHIIYSVDDGANTDEVIQFKDNLPNLTDEEIGRYYNLRLDAKTTNRNTDLNDKCIDYILNEVCAYSMGGGILDAGGGRCYLARRIFELTLFPVTVFDFQRPKSVPEGINFIEGNIKKMPFVNKEFDVTLCTHTLEHIRDPQVAISELLRVTKQKLIIVMPKQREYRYTNDLHINFCPYLYSFKEFIGIKNAEYSEIDGDFICIIHTDT